MAMPKARLVIKVERDDSASDGNGIMVTVRDGEHGNYGEPYRVSLSGLKGAEILRVGANVGAGDLRSLNGQERIGQIQSRVFRDGYIPSEFVPKPRSEREPMKPPAPAPMTPVPAANPFPRPVELPPVDEPETQPETVNKPRCVHGIELGTRCNECDGEQREIESAPTYAPGSLEAIIADIASKVSPKVDTAEVQAKVTAAVMQEVKSHVAELEALPRRITIVTPVIERELPRLSHKLLPDIVQAVAAGNHVFLTGPAGSGKSTLAEQAFTATDRTTHPMSCDPSMMRTAIFGFVDANGNYHSTPAREAFESDAGGLMVDEIDNGHPSILAGMNQMLANGSCSFADRTVVKGAGFACIATANTWGLGATAEYVGRNPIDAATLDRFSVRFYVDYDAKMERLAALQYATDSTHATISEWIDYVQGLRRRVMSAGVKVLVTPRATIAGAKLIVQGLTIEKAKEWTVLAGMTDDIKGKVQA